MKQFFLTLLSSLSSLFLGGYAIFLRFGRAIGWIKMIPSSTLLLPPEAPGGLGDEAMVVASISTLRQQGTNHMGLVAFNPRLEYPVPVAEAIDMRDYFIYSSGLKFLQKSIEFGYKVSRYEQFYCLGADLMDGHYSDYVTLKRVKLVELAAKAGVKSTILGFSFNNAPTPLAVQALRSLPSHVNLYVRDAISEERLTARLNRPIPLVADVAFLLHPAESSELLSTVFQWIEKQRNTGRTLVGINPNSLLLKQQDGKTFEDLIQGYAQNLVSLFSRNPNLSFVLLPHDSRNIKGSPSDDRLARAILQELPVEMQPYCCKIPFPCRAAEIKAIVGKLDVVLSSRMHLAIACLGQSIPVVCITYQGKFDGLFRHFAIEGMTVSPEDLLQPESEKVVNCVISTLENREKIHQKIQVQLPQVQQLSLANFA